MKTLFKQLLLLNWQRKSVALLLGIIVWLVVNHSLSSTKTINNISMRVINIPEGKTIEGMQSNGKLNKRLSITLVGNAHILDKITPNDLEVVIDASDKPNEWVNTITKKELVSLNPEIDVSRGVSRIYQPGFVLRMTNLVSEEIPVTITTPIGEAPRGYQFVGVWPYSLNIKVSGPEDVIKQLKTKDQKITFNLNDISKAQLDALAIQQNTDKTGRVSFFVPDQWKQIQIPLLSDQPISINDPQEKGLRIDFIRCNLIPFDSVLTVSMFYPPEYIQTINPSSLRIKPNNLIQEIQGIYFIKTPLFAKGTDSLFTEIVKNWIQIAFIAAPNTPGQSLEWSLQFINSMELENQYIRTLISDTSDEDIRMMKPSLREEYLRNRFRSYMNRLELFRATDEPFALHAKIDGNFVYVEETVASP